MAENNVTGKSAYISWASSAGTIDLATDFRSVSIKENTDTAETTAGADTHKTYLPTIKSATIRLFRSVSCWRHGSVCGIGCRNPGDSDRCAGRHSKRQSQQGVSGDLYGRNLRHAVCRCGDRKLHVPKQRGLELTMVELLNGAKIEYDWTKITQTEMRKLADKELDVEISDGIVGKTVGMTADELVESATRLTITGSARASGSHTLKAESSMT